MWAQVAGSTSTAPETAPPHRTSRPPGAKRREPTPRCGSRHRLSHRRPRLRATLRLPQRQLRACHRLPSAAAFPAARPTTAPVARPIQKCPRRPRDTSRRCTASRGQRRTALLAFGFSMTLSAESWTSWPTIRPVGIQTRTRAPDSGIAGSCPTNGRKTVADRRSAPAALSSNVFTRYLLLVAPPFPPCRSSLRPSGDRPRGAEPSALFHRPRCRVDLPFSSTAMADHHAREVNSVSAALISPECAQIRHAGLSPQKGVEVKLAAGRLYPNDLPFRLPWAAQRRARPGRICSWRHELWLRKA